ncbi:MAG: redoxin domain-containing protein [Deltaproteobacteria bacterium]|nr:redoxin domain-containing protein [Deltaproteobacteria bacterium]
MKRLLLVSFLLLTACSSPEPATQAVPAEATPAPTPAAKAEPKSPGVVSVEKPRWTDEDGNAVESPTPRKAKRWNGLVTGNWKDPLPHVAPDQRCVVLHTKVGSPARASGLQEMDVIVTSAGKPVKNYKDYLEGAKTVEIGESLELEVLRDGQPLTVSVGMLEKPANMITFQKQAFPGSEGFEFEVPRLRPDGGTLSSADRNGRVQILYFWATWCGPCRRTSPIVSKLHDELSDKVQVIGVSSEEEAVISKYLDSHPEYTYPVAHDDKRALKRRYEVKKLPTIALVGKDGSVVDWDISIGGVNRLVAKARELAAE